VDTKQKRYEPTILPCALTHFRASVTGVATRKERYEPTILQCGKHMGEEVRAYNSTMCRTHQQHLGVATRKKRYEPTILPCGSNKEKRYEPTILRARTHRYLGVAPMKEEVRAYNSCMGDTPQILASQSKSGHKKEEVRAYNSFR